MTGTQNIQIIYLFIVNIARHVSGQINNLNLDFPISQF